MFCSPRLLFCSARFWVRSLSASGDVVFARSPLAPAPVHCGEPAGWGCLVAPRTNYALHCRLPAGVPSAQLKSAGAPCLVEALQGLSLIVQAAGAHSLLSRCSHRASTSAARGSTPHNRLQSSNKRGISQFFSRTHLLQHVANEKKFCQLQSKIQLYFRLLQDSRSL